VKCLPVRGSPWAAVLGGEGDGLGGRVEEVGGALAQHGLGRPLRGHGPGAGQGLSRRPFREGGGNSGWGPLERRGSRMD